MEAKNNARLLIEQAKKEKRRALDEPTSKRILQSYGIQVPRSVVVRSADEIAAALKGLSLPVVLKLVSPDVLHKSDFGAVVLGLSDRDAIAETMQTLTLRCQEHGYQVDGFLLEEMAAKGHELVVGGYRDEDFGPVIMFGLGGIFVEILQDVAFRICPITEIDAKEMLAELRGRALLDGARGGVAVPNSVIIDTLLAVGGESGLLTELGDAINELDINPLLAGEHGVTALDARIVFAEG